jgi:hypothetical protein
VLTAHRSAYPNPIRFEAGDPLTLGERDDEYPGWIRVTTRDGRHGWAPEPFIDIRSTGQGVANTRYTARELDTVADEVLQCHRELNDWLWVENGRGETGWVPRQTTRPATGAREPSGSGET